MSNVMQEIMDYAAKISRNELENVRPGMPLRFTEACSVNDRIWQGDLAITIANEVPSNYKKVQNVTKQLVPGTTMGSQHCLDSLDGVTMYLPQTWNEESLDGPYLVLSKERTITHPVHGDVTIPAGFEVQITYQREYNKELEKEMRARD